MNSFVFYLITFLLATLLLLSTIAHPLDVDTDKLINLSQNGTEVKLPEINLPKELDHLLGDVTPTD